MTAAEAGPGKAVDITMATHQHTHRHTDRRAYTQHRRARRLTTQAHSGSPIPATPRPEVPDAMAVLMVEPFVGDDPGDKGQGAHVDQRSSSSAPRLGTALTMRHPTNGYYPWAQQPEERQYLHMLRCTD